jgi:iron complex transport system substrate-binding protein
MLLPLSKKVTFSFLTIWCAFSSVFCSSLMADSDEKTATEPFSASVEYPFVVVDDYGREVVFSKKPEKVISLAPSITELIYALGFGDRLEAVTEWCNRPQEVTQLPSVGRIDEPNLEVIIGLHPDAVIGTELTPRSVYNKLTQLGFPCIALKHDNLQDVMADSQTLASVFGDKKKGQVFSGGIQSDLANTLTSLEQVKSQPRRKVAFLFDINNLFSVGKNTWLGDLISTCHAENVGDDALSPWPKLTMEGLLGANPDVILVTDGTDASSKEILRLKIASLKDDPAWKHITAVKEGRVIILDNNGEYMIPGPRMIDALKGIAHAIYPECFTQE